MLSYQNAQEVVKNNPDVFYENKVTVQGYELSLFNYFLASYEDFKPEYAKELRGLCFLDNKPFYSLHKFFNVGENESTDINIVKNKKVKSIQEKSDGSLISFVLLPDNNVVAKSKMAFETTQARFAQNVIDNNYHLHSAIQSMLVAGLHPLFEYVAPENQVVVGYKKAELILLQVRDSSGKYLELPELKQYAEQLNVNYAEPLNITFNECLAQVDKLEGKEGWIIRFEDDTFVKLKTRWYLNLHRVVSNIFLSTHTIAQEVMNETIDDFTSAIQVGSTKEYIAKVHEATLQKYESIKNTVRNILSEITANCTERKNCHAIYGNKEEFGLIMTFFGKKFSEEELDKGTREFMLKHFTKNDKAKKFLNL